MKYIIPLIIILNISCSLFGVPTVKKGSQYLITYHNELYVFVVINIQRERTEKNLFESIDYKLYRIGSESKDILTSSIKYRNTKQNEHSYHLERIEGTTQISIGTLSFTWSHGSDNHIYLYLEDGTKIKKA